MEARDPTASTASPATFLKRLVVVMLLANLTVVALLALSLRQSRIQYREQAAVSTRNLALVLEQQLLGTIEKVDLALLSLADGIERQLAQGGVDGKGVSRSLARVHARLPELEGLRMASAQGEVVYGEGLVPGKPVSCADRDYFQRLRDDAGAGLVISRPILGRISGKWTISLARRLNRPDRSFAGVVYAVITLEQIGKTLSRLDVGPHGTVTVRDQQLGLIVRYPALAGPGGAIGDRLVSAAMNLATRSTPSAGTYRARPPFDHLERTFSYRKISGYPLFVNVGLASDDYLAQWYDHAGYAAGLAACFLLATLLSSWLIYRNWRRGTNAVGLLVASQEQIRILLESTAEAIYGVDLNGCCTFANPACCRLLGYDGAQELLGRQMHELCHHSHPDGSSFPLDQCRISNSFKDGSGVHVDDFAFWRKDGSHFPVECWSYPQLKNGLVVGAVVTFLDISERKRSQEALSANEAKFRMLFESSADPCLLIDGNCFVDCNQATVEILGAGSKSEVLDTHPWEVSPQFQPDGQSSLDKAEALIALAKSRGVLRFEWVHCRKDGSQFPVEVSLTVLPEHGLIYTVWRDITQRKQAEAELEQSRQQLLDIIDFLPDATLVTDSQGRVMAWNRAIEEMTGVGKAQMLGKGDHACTVPFYGAPRAHLIDLLDLDDREVAANYRHVQRKGKTLNAEGFTPALRGGAGAYVWATAAPLYNARGERAGAIEAIRDITDQKEAQATIIKYRDHLEEVVELRTQELLIAKEAAEAANRAKGEFMANMSHELRTPLNSIIGFSELTLQKGVAAEQHDYLCKILGAGKSLLAMINDLLDFARCEDETLQLERSRFALDEVLARVLPSAQQKALDKGLELLLFVPDGLPRQLEGDPNRLGQVLGNLLDNALKFTEKGEVELCLGCLQQSSDAAVLSFAVADSGIGMHAAQLEKLFQPFSPADGSSTRRVGGSGVGLIVSRRLANLMGGDITVASVPDQGSTFSFVARLAVAREDAAGEYAPPAPYRGAFPWIEAGYADAWARSLDRAYLEAASRFGKAQHPLLQGLSAALAAGDRMQAQRVARRLQGLAATLGVGRVREAAAELGRTLQDGQEASPGLERLAGSCEDFRAQLAAALDRDGAADAPGADPDLDVRSMLERLERYAHDYDGEALGYLQSVIATLRAALPEAPWSEIERLLERYELEEGLLLLRQVLDHL